MANNTFKENTMVSRNAKIVSSKLDEEVVMLDIEQGKYFGLDPVGARIWEIITSPISVAEIVATLVNEYDVSKEICEKDVNEFLEKMIELKTVQIALS